MKPYPVMMNLEGKTVLVVGGGKVALRKVQGLLECGALITVISPAVEPELDLLVNEGRINWIVSAFEEALLECYSDILLLFGATNDRNVSLRIYEAAIKRKIPCNIADVPDLCTFIVPAVITQGDLTIAVSTGGSSPALARRIREDLEKLFGPEYGTMTRMLANLRKQILETGSSSSENKKLFTEIVDSEVLAALRDQDRERALEILREILPGQVDPEPAIDAPPQSDMSKE